MREIKFRGKRADNGQWVYGYYATFQGINITNVHKILDDHFFIYGVIPETVGQYIGLKDKNSKEIYEGDLVKYNEGNNEKPVYVNLKVSYDNHGFYAIGSDGFDYLRKDFSHLDSYEVIGNIHEVQK